MCGIAGIRSFKSAVDVSALKKMTDAIIHRGPDNDGHWVSEDSSVGFGHRRLSIIDLSDAGKQPMHYLGRYTITFNGEIYNYIELREGLLQNGYKFASNSDTEVLMALYDHKKEACLNDLDGMFAFVIWDSKEKLLFCARDRFGEKPFYYHYQKEDSFCFASEMKALWAMGIQKMPDEKAIRKYLLTSELVNETKLSETFYSNIQQLEAAHYLIIKQNGELITQRYYDLESVKENRTISIEEAAGEFLNLLKKSIQLRLRSDVPVGSSLSGGLDSSAIVMLIDNLKKDNIKQKTFSARFKDFVNDEGKYIEKVVEKCKSVEALYTWPINEEMESELDKIIYHQEEPFASASIFAQYKVMQLARKENVTVLLDGQGADEQLAGYLPYFRLYLNQVFLTNHKVYTKEYKAYLENHGTVFPVEDLTTRETMRMKLGRIKQSLFHVDKGSESGFLKKQLLHDMQVAGLQTLLRYADRNSMAHSREVRLPYLSHHLVEFVFSLPDNYKLNNGWTKFIQRKAMESILPKEITWRVDKIGYEVPQNKLMDSPKVKETVNAVRKRIYDNGLLDKNLNANDWQCLMLKPFLN